MCGTLACPAPTPRGSLCLNRGQRSGLNRSSPLRIKGSRAAGHANRLHRWPSRNTWIPVLVDTEMLARVQWPAARLAKQGQALSKVYHMWDSPRWHQNFCGTVSPMRIGPNGRWMDRESDGGDGALDLPWCTSQVCCDWLSCVCCEHLWWWNISKKSSSRNSSSRWRANRAPGSSLPSRQRCGGWRDFHFRSLKHLSLPKHHLVCGLAAYFTWHLASCATVDYQVKSS